MSLNREAHRTIPNSPPNCSLSTITEEESYYSEDDVDGYGNIGAVGKSDLSLLRDLVSQLKEIPKNSVPPCSHSIFGSQSLMKESNSKAEADADADAYAFGYGNIGAVGKSDLSLLRDLVSQLKEIPKNSVPPCSRSILGSQPFMNQANRRYGPLGHVEKNDLFLFQDLPDKLKEPATNSVPPCSRSILGSDTSQPFMNQSNREADAYGYGGLEAVDNDDLSLFRDLAKPQQNLNSGFRRFVSSKSSHKSLQSQSQDQVKNPNDKQKNRDQKKGKPRFSERFIGEFPTQNTYDRFKQNSLVRQHLCQKIKYRLDEGKVRALIEFNIRMRAAGVESFVYPELTEIPEYLQPAEDGWSKLTKSGEFNITEENYGDNEDGDRYVIDFDARAEAKKTYKSQSNFLFID